MVRVYELEVEVDPTGKLRLELDSALPPGPHHAVLTVETNGTPAIPDEPTVSAAMASPPGWRGLPTVIGWPWGPQFTVRRSQIYDDNF